MTDLEALKCVYNYCVFDCGPLGHCDGCIILTIRDALEKQTPIRYVECDGMTHLGDTLIGFCPACGEPTNSDLPFCPMCGQAIEWSEKE